MIKASNPATIPQPDGCFSQAVVVDAGTRLLFVSGQVPRGPDGETVGEGDITAQAEVVFGSLAKVLAAHGTDFNSAIKATIFVTDMDRAGEVAEVRARHYGDARPASTFVEVSALGDPRWLLEVELVAAIPA